MNDLSNALEPYKLRARRHRGKALDALESGDAVHAQKEFEKAHRALAEALDHLRSLGVPDLEVAKPAREGEIAIAGQIADCHGMIGGIYRTEGKFSEAIQEYDKGYMYESSRRFNILNSYNRVNRLVLRILDKPKLLFNPMPVGDVHPQEGKSMRQLLRDCAVEIDRQLREGRADKAWALADLALVRLLGGLEGVETALDALDESAKDYFPYESMLKVIRDLTQKQLAVAGLVDVGERLRRKLPQSIQGEPLRGYPE
ncbi:MAG: hypothetical protein WAV20_03210, partial [Blastocatellia bacterium]